MTRIEDSELLGRVIETLNDSYPDDLLNQAYEMLVEGEDYDLDDTLAVFIVTEIARVIKPGRQSLKTALKAVSDHFQTYVEDLQSIRKAII